MSEVPKFSDLNESKRQFIISLLNVNKDIGKTKGVSRETIVNAWEDLKSKDNIKIGFPHWLLSKPFRLDKGIYKVPKPTKRDLELIDKGNIKSHKQSDIRKRYDNNTLSKEDMEYYYTLEKYNIKF